MTQDDKEAAERKASLERLKKELSPLSLSEYLQVSGQEIKAFDIVCIQHNEETVIGSGYSLPSITELVELARNNFVKKAPHNTERVVAVQEEIVEIPSTFWVRGKQRITYRGIALVPKQESF